MGVVKGSSELPCEEASADALVLDLRWRLSWPRLRRAAHARVLTAVDGMMPLTVVIPRVREEGGDGVSGTTEEAAVEVMLFLAHALPRACIGDEDGVSAEDGVSGTSEVSESVP